jgi:hypothetical protein
LKNAYAPGAWRGECRIPGRFFFKIARFLKSFARNCQISKNIAVETAAEEKYNGCHAERLNQVRLRTNIRYENFKECQSLHPGGACVRGGVFRILRKRLRGWQACRRQA